MAPCCAVKLHIDRSFWKEAARCFCCFASPFINHEWIQVKMFSSWFWWSIVTREVVFDNDRVSSCCSFSGLLFLSNNLKHTSQLSRNPCCPPTSPPTHLPYSLFVFGLAGLFGTGQPALAALWQGRLSRRYWNSVSERRLRDRVWGSFEQQLVPLFLDKLPWRAAVKDKGKFIIKPDLHPLASLLSKHLKSLNDTWFSCCES